MGAMKVTRRKHFKRIMRFYATHFGIKEPFQVIGEEGWCAKPGGGHSASRFATV